MASRAVVPRPQIGGEIKQKNVQGGGDGKARRVLQDIGNFANERAAQAQGKLKSIAGLADVATVGKPGTKAVVAAAVAQRKLADKPLPEEVIEISSDEKEKTNSPCRRRREVKKSITAILSARSKVACGIANKPVQLVEDIDAGDAENHLAVLEYVDDIYKYYKESELEDPVQNYIDSQPELNTKMRAILVDWLIEVHRKFELMPETLYLTINIVDRFLSKRIVSRRELQLVGIGAMLIACKYEEIWAPEVNDFVFISDNAYVREQVLTMEKSILNKMEWYLTVPTPYVFLSRYIKASSPSDNEMENMVYFLAELGLMQYQTIVMYRPSLFAASAVYAARCTLDKEGPLWTETLKHHTGYSEDQLIDCAKLLAKFHSTAAESKLRAVYKKFSSVDHGAVALLSPAKSLLLNP